MDALEVAIKRAGVELIEDANVTAIATEHGRVIGVVSAGQRVDAGVVVVAAGAWSGQLFEPLGLKIELIPARGQMLAVRSDKCPITRVLHSRSVYVVPRRDGRILIGATVEYAGFRRAVTVGAIRQLMGAATGLVPSVEYFDVIECWSGLRPDTVDHLPVLGASGITNLLLATGHFRNGILLAPLTANLISETLIDGREPSEITPFSIVRPQLASTCAYAEKVI